MHSYTSLTVLALAVSTASSAYSAPVQDSHQQARAVIGGPLNIGIGDDSNETSNVSVTLEHILGDNSMRRALPRDTGHLVDLNQRASAVGGVIDDLLSNPTLKNVLESALGGAVSAAAAFGTSKLLNSTKRDGPFLPPNDCVLGDPLCDAACIAEHPVQRDDASTRDIIGALYLLRRQLNELD